MIGTSETWAAPPVSPTRTATWDTCSLLNQLQNVDYWVPRVAGNKEIAGWAGIAFAKAAAQIAAQKHRLDPNPLTSVVGTSTELAIDCFKQHVDHYRNGGMEIRDVSIELVIAEFKKTIPRYYEDYPFTGWQIDHVEHELPSQGRCRIDIGGRDQHGILSVADIKYKRNLKADYIDSTVEDYRSDWQFLHYPWAYGEYRQEACHRMYLCLVIAQPTFSVRLIPIEIHPDTMKMWLQSARVKWVDIASEKDGTRPIAMAAHHRTQYGPCVMRWACFDAHLDEQLMKREYIQIGRL